MQLWKVGCRFDELVDEIARWYLVSLAPASALLRSPPGSSVDCPGTRLLRATGGVAGGRLAGVAAGEHHPALYENATLIGSAVIVAVICWLWAFRERFVDQGWLRPSRRKASFCCLGYLWFRGYTLIITGNEKPMDSAFLLGNDPGNRYAARRPVDGPARRSTTTTSATCSTARSRGLPIRRAGRLNLALATVFAMSVTAAAGLGWGIVRTRLGQRLAPRAGALSAFLIMVAGNMLGPVRLLEDSDLVWNGFWFQNVGWESSRVIVDVGSQQEEAITESSSQLRPRRSSSARAGAAVHDRGAGAGGVALSIARARTEAEAGRRGGRRARATARLRDDWRYWRSGDWVIIGALYLMNSWDFPTYLGAAAIAILIGTGPTLAFVEQVAPSGSRRCWRGRRSGSSSCPFPAARPRA